MDLPTPGNNTPHSTTEDAERFFQSEEYQQALKILAQAKAYIDRTVGEEAGIDYMISEIKNLFNEGKFSDHCYEYAEKEAPPLTEAQIAELLPKNDDGKAIFSWRDVW